MSLYDLKVKNLFEILNNTENDSKMDEESDVEITNEEFTAIITNFVIQLMNYLNKNKVTLRDVIKDLIQTLNVEEEDTNQEKIEIVLVESFLNRMKEIGIQINNDIETFCIYNRYKLTDEYEIISYGGRVAIIPFVAGHSTTELIRRILRNGEERPSET